MFMAREQRHARRSTGSRWLVRNAGLTITVALLIAGLSLFLLVQAGVASAASRDVVLRGTLLVAHADARGGESDADFYLLKTHDGYFDLRFNRTPKLKPNQGVLVSGIEEGRQLFVSEIQATGDALAVAQTGNTLSTLIIPVTWPSAPPDSVTPAQAELQVGGVDDAWYEETSYGSVGMAATATPWMTIADPGGGCPLAEIVIGAEAAATASGYVPSGYDREMVYVPWTSSICPGFAGFGQVGGRISWILGAMDTRVTVHELGHNLGLWHAHSLRCTDAGGQVPYGPSCDPFDEYGDLFDAMGAGWYGTGHFNAAQKKLLGWMSGRYVDVSPPIRSPLRVDLSPLETDGGLKALAIHADGTTFWVEYREVLGVDSWLGNFLGALNGVLVHIPQPSDASNGSNLLDMTPNSADGFRDAALPVGASYTDPSRSFTLRVRSTSPGGVSLVVRRPAGKEPSA
jgi:Gametolysin peptidase M11